METELESKRNIEIQLILLKYLQTPSKFRDLYTPLFEKYGLTKNEIIMNLNYLIIYQGRITNRNGMLYLTENAPKKWFRKHGGQKDV